MADETFEIGFSVTGQGDASKAFEDLKLAEMEAKDEAAELSKQFKELKESGSATAEEIEATARAMIRAKQEAARLAAEARKVAAAKRQMGSAAQGAKTQQGGLNESIRVSAQVSAQARQTMGGLGAATGQLGSALGAVAPQLGAFGSGLGSVAGHMSQLSGALGPMGVGIAAVTGAISLAQAAFNSIDEPLRRVERRHREHAEQVRRNAREYDTLVTNLRNARQRFNELFGSQGEGATQGAEDRVTAQRQQIERIEERLRRARTRANEGVQRTTSQYEIPGLGAFEAETEGVGADATVRRLQAELEQARGRLTQMELSRDVTAGRTSDRERDAALGDIQADENRRADEARRRGQQAAAEAQREAQRLEREREREMAAVDAPGEAAEVAALAEAWSRVADAFRELDETGGVDILGSVRDELDQTLALRDQAHAEQIRAQQAQVRERARVEGEWLDEYARMVEGLQGLDEETRRGTQRALRARQDDHAAYLQALREMEASHTQWTAEELQRRSEIIREELATQRALHERQEDQVRQIEEQMWGGLAGTVTSAMGDMYGFLISGAEGGGEAFLRLLDQFLEKTSIEYTIKALAEAAEAAMAAARYDPVAAAAHATAAGLAAGVAAATGLASAAISVPSVGSASNAPSQAQPQQAPGGGPTTVNVQLYAPQAVFTEAERGQILASGMRAARREFGASAART